MKPLRDVSSKSYKKIKETVAKVKSIREELDLLKKVKEESSSSTHPEIDTINENFVAELAALKEERKNVYTKYDEEQKAYYEQ